MTVLQQALRQRNEAMDEIAHACEVLSAYLNLTDDQQARPWDLGRAGLIGLRDRLRDFYCREWPEDEG